MTSRNKSAILDLTYAAVFAALIIVLGVVVYPTASGVPIVLQNAAIVLAALVLGPKRGFYAVALFLLCAAINLPVLVGKSLWVALAGPTFGYIIGYAICPFVAGAISGLAIRNNKLSMSIYLFLGAVAGIATQYLFGVAWLIGKMGLTTNKALAAQVPFLPIDFGKAVLITVIALAVHLALPHLRTFRTKVVTA